MPNVTKSDLNLNIPKFKFENIFQKTLILSHISLV